MNNEEIKAKLEKEVCPQHGKRATVEVTDSEFKITEYCCNQLANKLSDRFDELKWDQIDSEASIRGGSSEIL